MLKKYIVKKDYHETRFDRWFKQKVLNLPQSLLEKLIRKKRVKVNKKKTKTSYRLQTDDIIEIHGLKDINLHTYKEKKIYKPTLKEVKKYSNFVIDNNKNFIVINKPSGIPVQSGTKSFKNIIDLLRDSSIFGNGKPYIVHRLDKETSGIMLIAKNREYAQLLTSLFRLRKIHKTYIAICYGEINKNIKLLKDNLILYDNKKKIIQKAISYIKVIKTNGKYSLLELKPVTGRKHQLRKQLLNIGNPIVGDNKYFLNKTKRQYKKLMLHASSIKFMINNKKFNFLAKYEKNFEEFLKKI